MGKLMSGLNSRQSEPLLWLHFQQAVVRFLTLSVPPRDEGLMWSIVAVLAVALRSPLGLAHRHLQYRHVQLSRSNTR